MKPSLNRAKLRTDLDAEGHKILNLPNDQPLNGIIPDGAISDRHVAHGAAINQDKLNLSGDIPIDWLGTADTQAAPGNLSEYLTNKAQPNGYASLDGSGRIPAGQLPASAGTGTVTSVGVTTANGVSGTVATPTTTPAITLILGLITPDAVSVNGTAGAGVVTLASQTIDPALATALKLWSDSDGKLCISSGTLNGFKGFKLRFDGPALTADRTYHWPDKPGTVVLDSDIPTMVGVGGGHKGGLVIDPGASGAGTDYLARDATWKSAATFSAPSYQPILPTMQIFPTSNTTGARNISLGTNGATGTGTFYEIDDNTGPFIPTAGVPIPLPPLSTLYCYQSKPGYTNSPMASYTNPNTS